MVTKITNQKKRVVSFAIIVPFVVSDAVLAGL